MNFYRQCQTFCFPENTENILYVVVSSVGQYGFMSGIKIAIVSIINIYMLPHWDILFCLGAILQLKSRSA